VTTAHEPRRGPGIHLSAEDLSALAEGAEPTAAGAAEHLLECAACQGEVDAVSELLAQFEEWDVPAMPQEVAIRIDAALARESAARAATSGHPAAAAIGHETSASSGSTSPESTSPGSASPGSKSPVHPAHSRRRRWMPTPALAWSLAALVLIAGGLGLVVKLGISSTQSSNSAASGSSATTPYAAQGGSGSSGPKFSNQHPQALTELSPDSPLATWTKQTLSNRRPDATINSPCLSDPAFHNDHVVAIANGPYNGTDATLVVYANPDNAATVIAVVYATPCTTTNYRVLAGGLVAK
jgi:hypothetical protein